MKVIKAIMPEKIKSSSSFMDVSEQDSFNSGGRSQKKCLMTFGSQKDNFSKPIVCVNELIMPPTHDPMTRTTQTIFVIATV